MFILALIFTILSACSIGLSLYKPKYGALCYLVYMYLAPYMYIGGFIIYARTSAFIFLGLFLLNFYKKLQIVRYKAFLPYLLFLALNFIYVISAESISISFNAWLTSVSSFFFILFLYNSIKSDIHFVPVFKWTFFGMFCIFTLYGLLLTLTPGINPYKMIEQPMFGQEFNVAYAMGLSGNAEVGLDTEVVEERVFGRISSVFDHPMAYALNLGFFFIYSIFILKNKRKVLIPVCIFILAAIFTCGVRTPIAALAATFFACLLYLRKFKYFAYGLLAFLSIVIVVPLISHQAGDLMMSIVTSDDSEVRGSSLGMRLTQLGGCIDIVQDNLFLGKGYGWTNWYNSENGGHPVALYFESLIFTILVNTGLTGFIVWGIFLAGYYLYARRIKDKVLRLAILALMLYFLAFCTITGDFRIGNLYPFLTIMVCIGFAEKIQRKELRMKEAKIMFKKRRRAKRKRKRHA